MSLSILIQVTHLLGAGHLTRAAALATACAKRGHKVALLSGGVPRVLQLNAGFETVQMAPVKVEGTAFTCLLTPEGTKVGDSYMIQRRESALAAVAHFKPDILITELFPFGRRVLADEFLATIDAARAQDKPVSVLASIRDILATPSRPDRIIETEQRFRDHYDAVLVHGDPALVPLESSWPVSDELRAMLHYTGYIDNPSIHQDENTDRSDIIVSGGSSSGSLPLYRAAIQAATQIGRSWRILVGNGVNEADFNILAATTPANAIVERARPDFRALLARATLSISQCGYNTALDVLGVPLRRLFVPFEGDHETEQFLRAETLARNGAAHVLRESELSGEKLAATVLDLLAKPAPTLAPLRRNGAETSVDLIETLARTKRA